MQTLHFYRLPGIILAGTVAQFCFICVLCTEQSKWFKYSQVLIMSGCKGIAVWNSAVACYCVLLLCPVFGRVSELFRWLNCHVSYLCSAADMSLLAHKIGTKVKWFPHVKTYVSPTIGLKDGWTVVMVSKWIPNYIPNDCAVHFKNSSGLWWMVFIQHSTLQELNLPCMETAFTR